MSEQDERRIEAPNWSRLDLSGSAVEMLRGKLEAADARVQALEAEKAQRKQFDCGHMIWKIKRSDDSYIEHGNMQCPTCATIRAAEAENARLRAALKEYGHHRMRCPANPYNNQAGDCNCGLDDAALTDPRREEELEPL